MVNEEVDPTFRFMTVDGDGQIRMDPSSVHAMQRLIGMKDRFDFCFACDTDHDRHGIVTSSAGLLPPNRYRCSAIWYLFQHRPQWRPVSCRMIERVAVKPERKLYETPVGFKWFVDGLLNSSLAFGGKESAGASFSRLDGSVWTRDKDGIVPALLAAEVTATMGRDPGEIDRSLTQDFGDRAYERIDAPATPRAKELLSAGPSGTESVYKIYAASFRGTEHLRLLRACLAAGACGTDHPLRYGCVAQRRKSELRGNHERLRLQPAADRY